MVFRHALSSLEIWLMTVNQIQQRKQENPHNVDEMPVQPDVLHRSVVLRREAPAQRFFDEPEQQARADDHVQGVQPGHAKVQGKEKLRVGIGGHVGAGFKIKIPAGDVVLDVFVVVLDAFDAEKHAAEYQRRNEEKRQKLFLTGLRSPHGHGHGQAASDEHHGVHRAEPERDGLAGLAKNIGIRGAIQRVGHEQPTEEQHLGGQKNPHPLRRGFPLLLHRFVLPEQLSGAMHSALLTVLVVSVRKRRRTGYGQSQIRPVLEIVRLPGDFGRDFEIFGGRRRIRLPLKPGSGPGVAACDISLAHGPNQINHRKQVAERKNGRPGAGHYVEHLKFRRIAGVAARHAEVAENELREKRQVKSEEQHHGGDAREKFRVEFSRDLGPPEMEPAHVTHHRAANHDVVEMGDHEVGVVNVNVQPKTSQEEARQPADEEQADEAESVQHGRVVRNGSFVQRGSPVEDFDGGRNGHQVAQERERQRGVGRLASEKHVVRPNEEADDGNSDARAGDEGITEYRLARKGRYDLADHAHGRQNHDVNGRMRIKPEEVLEENRIATQGGIEESEVEHALQAGEQQGDGNHGSAENEDDARGVLRPDKQRQAKPRHSRSAHGVHGDDKIQAGENGGEAVDEYAEHCGGNGGVRIHAAEWRVERPAGVETTGGERIKNETSADQIDVPAQEIDLG